MRGKHAVERAFGAVRSLLFEQPPAAGEARCFAVRMSVTPLNVTRVH